MGCEKICRILESRREIRLLVPVDPVDRRVPPQPGQLPLGILAGAELDLLHRLLRRGRAVGHRQELLVSDGLQGRGVPGKAPVQKRLHLLQKPPADAAAEVIEASRYVSEFRGGEGAVRDIVEQVLRARGDWARDSQGVTPSSLAASR